MLLYLIGRCLPLPPAPTTPNVLQHELSSEWRKGNVPENELQADSMESRSYFDSSKLTRPSGDERLEDPMFASLPGNPRSSQLELKAYGFLRG